MPNLVSVYALVLQKVMWEVIARRLLLALSGALAAFLIYLLFVNADSSPPGQSATSGAIEKADAKISEFVFTQTKGDVVQWKVQARQARLFEQEKRAVLDNVEVTLYGQAGKEMTVLGDEGVLDTATKNFVLANRSEPLTIATGSGYTIYTNHVAWTDSTKIIQTEDPVHIVGNGLEITGRGLLGRTDSEEFEVLNDVHVDLAPAS